MWIAVRGLRGMLYFLYMASLSVRRAVLAILGAMLVLFAAAYLYMQAFWHGVPGNKVSVDDQCKDPGAQKENPNKMLFISCGGFLE